MRRRRLVFRVSAVCLSVALAGAYIAYRVTSARRVPPPEASGQPSLAPPPWHFGGTKRGEIFEVQPAEAQQLTPGTKDELVIRPRDRESKPRSKPAAQQEPESPDPPVSPR